MSSFGLTPPPPSVRTSYMDAPFRRMLPVPSLSLACACALLGSIPGYAAAAAADYCHMELPLYRGDLALRPDVASIPVHLDLRVKDLVGNQCNVVGCWLLTVE